ncbi:MAG TPA: uracil phosphoribosyltransferase [Ktedonobacterales bacterium]|nr:uracil phosphoribosyltransferase [Ktedonobacterales bacterium]
MEPSTDATDTTGATGANDANDDLNMPMRGVAQPTRDEALRAPGLNVSRHPIIASKLTALRDETTTPAQFYALVRELGALLAFEATADLATEPWPIRTPLEPMVGQRLAGGVGVAPILRAGLGMAEGFRQMLPEAQIWHLGLRRDERTLRPVHYYNQLARATDLRVCYVVDPMLATGGSAIDALNLLSAQGIRSVRYLTLIAAPYGLVALRRAHPATPIYVAAVDDHLDERGYIRPGLGDAGDRQFNTL